jgi:hypothetical protein
VVEIVNLFVRFVRGMRCSPQNKCPSGLTRISRLKETGTNHGMMSISLLINGTFKHRMNDKQLKNVHTKRD